jgi:hypothetical protein
MLSGRESGSGAGVFRLSMRWPRDFPGLVVRSESWQKSFPGLTSQVREARRFLAGHLDGCPVADWAVHEPRWPSITLLMIILMNRPSMGSRENQRR